MQLYYRVLLTKGFYGAFSTGSHIHDKRLIGLGVIVFLIQLSFWIFYPTVFMLFIEGIVKLFLCDIALPSEVL